MAVVWVGVGVCVWMGMVRMWVWAGCSGVVELLLLLLMLLLLGRRERAGVCALCDGRAVYDASGSGVRTALESPTAAAAAWAWTWTSCAGMGKHFLSDFFAHDVHRGLVHRSEGVRPRGQRRERS